MYNQHINTRKTKLLDSIHNIFGKDKYNESQYGTYLLDTFSNIWISIELVDDNVTTSGWYDQANSVIHLVLQKPGPKNTNLEIEKNAHYLVHELQHFLDISKNKTKTVFKNDKDYDEYAGNYSVYVNSPLEIRANVSQFLSTQTDHISKYENMKMVLMAYKLAFSHHWAFYTPESKKLAIKLLAQGYESTKKGAV